MKNSQLLAKHPTYTAVYDQMLTYAMAYLGGSEFKRLVRKKRPTEDAQFYQDLVNNTIAQPIARYIVDSINDVLFEPAIKRDLQFCDQNGTILPIDNIEWANLFLADACLTNRSLNAFMEVVGDLSSIFGHCWVAVDMPRENESNLGRPYVCAISPLDVWDWHYIYLGGKPMLNYIKIKEGEDHEYYYIKCFYLGSKDKPSYWQQYKVEKSNSNSNHDVQLAAEGYFPMGMTLPCFIAYGKRDPRSIEFGLSDIDAATDAMREHYKLEVEAYSAIQFARTLIRADKGIAIPVHAGAIVRATQGQVEAISIDQNDIAQIIAKQKDILDQIEALTGLGGLRNQRNQVQSGISIIEERKTLHRLAKSKARLMEVTEELIFTYAARFMNMRWAGEVVYSTDYESSDTNYRMAVMKYAHELVPNNKIIDHMVTKEIIGMLAPPNMLPQYLEAYYNMLEDDPIKKLLMDPSMGPMSRDLLDQMPLDIIETDIDPNNRTIVDSVNSDQLNHDSSIDLHLMNSTLNSKY